MWSTSWLTGETVLLGPIRYLLHKAFLPELGDTAVLHTTLKKNRHRDRSDLGLIWTAPDTEREKTTALTRVMVKTLGLYHGKPPSRGSQTMPHPILSPEKLWKNYN